MEAEQLRALQAPLKQTYKEKPEAALVTLRAQGRVDEGISCKIETGKALVRAGLHHLLGDSRLLPEIRGSLDFQARRNAGFM